MYVWSSALLRQYGFVQFILRGIRIGLIGQHYNIRPTLLCHAHPPTCRNQYYELIDRLELTLTDAFRFGLLLPPFESSVPRLSFVYTTVGLLTCDTEDGEILDVGEKTCEENDVSLPW